MLQNPINEEKCARCMQFVLKNSNDVTAGQQATDSECRALLMRLGRVSPVS